MKPKNSDECGPIFVEYDDENIEHVMNAPDYGQVDTGSKVMAWSEIESKEYEDFVDYLTCKIINNQIKIFKSPL